MKHEDGGHRKGRLLFIDVARTFAILLALLAHFIGSFSMPVWFGSVGENYPFITSMATPMFIFMFGFMMEYVYVSKAYTSWSPELLKRIYVRSFQCYIGFVLTSLAALLGGHIDILTFIKSLVMLEATKYSNILLLYSLYLLLLPGIIFVRLKFGIIILTFITIFIYYLTSVVPEYKDIDFGILGYFMNNIFGLGKNTGGPSALFGLIFVFSGMIVASALRESNANSINKFYIYLVVIVAISFIILIALNDLSSVRMIKDYLTHYSYGSFRGSNNYNYFLMGTLYSCVNLGLICILFESFSKINNLPSVVTSAGRASLFTFAFGNILLNLFTSTLVNVDPGLSIFLFFTVVIVGARFIHKLPYYSEINRLLNLNFTKRG
jgi:hypothetical protein